MSAEILYVGHSTFQIRTASHTILIDPFYTDNPATEVSPDDVNPDFIIVTHGHFDHVGDTVSIAKRTGALVISNFEIASWFEKQGVPHTHGMHLGGEFGFDFGRLKLTIAHHGSMLPDGSYGGNPAGVVLKLDEGNIYHAGDTALFYDMNLIADEELDLAILPIGDNFTMGPSDSVRAVEFLRCPNVIPCHYNTWPPIEQDTEAWAAQVREKTESEPIVLAPGQTWTLD